MNATSHTNQGCDHVNVGALTLNERPYQLSITFDYDMTCLMEFTIDHETLSIVYIM